jgi:ribosome-associated toxin RatA of RatAB toxin-antitoxin module
MRLDGIRSRARTDRYSVRGRRCGTDGLRVRLLFETAELIQIRRSALVRYSPGQMFDLVNDIEAYPRRFSWCVAADILASEETALTARLEVRVAGLTTSFTTRNALVRPERIGMALVDGPFRALNGGWVFSPLGEVGCKIALELDFEYSGALLGPALRMGFQGLADRMVDEFVRVAARVYG